MLVFNCTMSKKGSSYGICGQRGKEVRSARNGKVRKGILPVLVYTLVCELEEVHLPVSEQERMCMRSTVQGNARGGSGP